MIPRYQRILFWSLTGAILLMSAFLLRGCQQAQKRLTALNNESPIAAPTSAAIEDVTLYLANDADGTITPSTAKAALPQDPTLRARALLEYLLGQYAQPDSAHPIKGGAAIDDVFLLNDPGSREKGKLAIINLHGDWVANHPSGVEVEDLTLKSIIGTLHGALPEIAHVRFLVDGQQRETLAGHAALNRSYPAIDTTARPTAPSEAATQP
ncbi:MAG: GerMN domain-containing protein [Edaphobacter sp.]|uniref:GerMN domain-containing protein n=1 Tax=Edaphobacter sp. TaxID=1934404 RepID=UPI0023949F12|nr:GerMN domain-containing protein [Edaphobacter sp.]MDE1176057.1 GerMN domain-containing protein [Edaphobacter sp.]